MDCLPCMQKAQNNNRAVTQGCSSPTKNKKIDELVASAKKKSIGKDPNIHDALQVVATELATFVEKNKRCPPHEYLKQIENAINQY